MGAGAKEIKVNKSNRKKTENDEIRSGEHYKAPADEPDRLVEAIEEPGVLAGSSAVHNLPDIQIKRDGSDGYVYCPLRVRIDQDRVHRQVHACGLFDYVRPIGSGRGPFTEHPWRHMAPY